MATFSTRMFLKLLRRLIYSSEANKFKPLIPLRADQVNFTIPVQVNSSSMLFGQGTPETLNRCKAEGVTFFGALTAAVVVAFYTAADEENRRASPFKLSLDIAANMRERVASPAPEFQVGAYLHSDALKSFSDKGVEMHLTKFWDLARSARSEVDAHLPSMRATMKPLYMDDYLTSNLTQEVIDKVRLTSAVNADVLVSNIGKYPYAATHAFQTGGGGDGG